MDSNLKKTENKLKASDMYVSSSQNLSTDSMCRDSDSHLLESSQNSLGGTNFSLFDPGFFGNTKDNLFVDFLDNEESDRLPHSDLEKFSDASQSNISKPSRRRTKSLRKLTEDDFEEGAERNAFLIVDGFAKKLFSNKSSQKTFTSAIAFFFTISDDGNGITFPLCCDVLGARANIIRLRIQYEWWLRSSIFTGPFPFHTVPIPKIVAGEIMYYGGEKGYALAREMWVQPGISTNELISSIIELDGHSKRDLQSALEHLEERFLVSCQTDRWYLTGRNPLLMNIRAESIPNLRTIRGGSFHWSRLFGTYE
jgi:hypothetical protein